MASTLTQADLVGLLDVLDAGRTSAAPEGLPMPLLERLQMLIRCDSISFMEFDMTRHQGLLDQTFSDEEAVTELPGEDVFWLHYDQDLHCSYSTRTGDDRTVTTVSDFYSLRETHNTPMYREFTRYFGVEHELLLCLPAPHGKSTRLLFARGPGRDFDARDRLLLALLRPHLQELNEELKRQRRPIPDLTARQWELLRLTARGHTNAEIARALSISTDTVRKHLENIFGRLGATTRMAAVAKAFPNSSP